MINKHTMNLSIMGSPRLSSGQKTIGTKNTIMDGMTTVLASYLSGTIEGGVNCMYIEYINLASPGDPIAIPTYDKEDDVSYYMGLQYSPDIDIVRVPISLRSNPEPNYAGNLEVSFYAATSAIAGQFGKPLEAASNSAVYGCALVYARDMNNMSQDIVVARHYPVGARLEKADGEQVICTWPIEIVINTY